jgi:hypothetical protein
LTTLANSALVANLVPALAERGVAATTAALFGGLMGAMQLPGRALLMSGMFGGSPATLLAGTLALHAGGLTLVTFGASTPVVATGTTVFALGAGLTTLVRPHLVHSMCNVEGGGAVNGRIARRQQFARACGPIVIAWLASRVSYGAVFAALAALFTIAAVTTLAALEKSNRTTEELEVV